MAPSSNTSLCPSQHVPRIGRRARRKLTNALNIPWSGIRMPSSWPPRQQRLRRRWGYRGVRVGEALHPGPSPGTPLHPAIGRGRSPSPPDDDARPLRRRVAPPPDVVRCFCPVPGCGHADATRASGWGSHDAMRHHLDDHCTGTLAGAVPREYLDAHRLDLCSVCGLLVARRFNGVHPRCCPRARQQLPNHRPAGLMDAGLPSLDGIMELDVPTLRHVPHVARSAWAQCLARAASAAAVSNTVPAWQELLMLPKAVLVAPTRFRCRPKENPSGHTFNFFNNRAPGRGCWPGLRKPLGFTWMLPFFACFSACGSVFPLQALMAIAPCATGSRTASGIMLGRALAAAIARSATTASGRSSLLGLWPLDSALRSRNKACCLNGRRSMGLVNLAVAATRHSDGRLMFTSLPGGPMGQQLLISPPPVACEAQCFPPPLHAVGLLPPTTKGESEPIRTRSSSATAKVSSSCLLWLKLAVVGGAPPLLPLGKNLGRCMELASG